MSSINLFHRLVSMCPGDCDNSCCQPMKTLAMEGAMGVPTAVPKICLKISPSNSKTLLWSICSTISSSRWVGGAWVSRWSLSANVSVRDVVTSWWGILEYSPTTSRVTMRASGGRGSYVRFQFSVVWRKWVVSWMKQGRLYYWLEPVVHQFWELLRGSIHSWHNRAARGLFLSLCTLVRW